MDYKGTVVIKLVGDDGITLGMPIDVVITVREGEVLSHSDVMKKALDAAAKHVPIPVKHKPLSTFTDKPEVKASTLAEQQKVGAGRARKPEDKPPVTPATKGAVIKSGVKVAKRDGTLKMTGDMT
jgi:hypothetical protein